MNKITKSIIGFKVSHIKVCCIDLNQNQTKGWWSSKGKWNSHATKQMLFTNGSYQVSLIKKNLSWHACILILHLQWS